MADHLRRNAAALWAAAHLWTASAAPAVVARLRRTGASLRFHASAFIRARVAPAAPRLIAASLGVAVCATGLVMVWPDAEATARLAAADPSPAAIEDQPTASLGQWLKVPKPMALYSLESADLPAGKRSYEARRHSVGMGREDMLVFNEFDEDKLFLSLRFYRPGSEARDASSLFVQTARHAAQDGLVVERMATPIDMRSKFGPIETADATIGSIDSKRACVALRAGLADGRLEIGGVACGPEKRPIDRALLSCLVDRIVLLASGDDSGVRRAFADAELKRQPHCHASRIAANGRKPTWLDPAGQAPALKGAMALKSR